MTTLRDRELKGGGVKWLYYIIRHSGTEPLCVLWDVPWRGTPRTVSGAVGLTTTWGLWTARRQSALYNLFIPVYSRWWGFVNMTFKWVHYSYTRRLSTLQFRIPPEKRLSTIIQLKKCLKVTQSHSKVMYRKQTQLIFFIPIISINLKKKKPQSNYSKAWRRLFGIRRYAVI